MISPALRTFFAKVVFPDPGGPVMICTLSRRISQSGGRCDSFCAIVIAITSSYKMRPGSLRPDRALAFPLRPGESREKARNQECVMKEKNRETKLFASPFEPENLVVFFDLREGIDCALAMPEEPKLGQIGGIRQAQIKSCMLHIILIYSFDRE